MGDRTIGKKKSKLEEKKSLTSKVGLPKEKMVSFNLNGFFFFFGKFFGKSVLQTNTRKKGS